MRQYIYKSNTTKLILCGEYKRENHPPVYICLMKKKTKRPYFCLYHTTKEYNIHSHVLSTDIHTDSAMAFLHEIKAAKSHTKTWVSKPPTEASDNAHLSASNWADQLSKNIYTQSQRTIQRKYDDRIEYDEHIDFEDLNENEFPFRLDTDHSAPHGDKQLTQYNHFKQLWKANRIATCYIPPILSDVYSNIIHNIASQIMPRTHTQKILHDFTKNLLIRTAHSFLAGIITNALQIHKTFDDKYVQISSGEVILALQPSDLPPMVIQKIKNAAATATSTELESTLVNEKSSTD